MGVDKSVQPETRFKKETSLLTSMWTHLEANKLGQHETPLDHQILAQASVDYMKEEIQRIRHDVESSLTYQTIKEVSFSFALSSSISVGPDTRRPPLAAAPPLPPWQKLVNPRLAQNPWGLQLHREVSLPPDVHAASCVT